MFQVTDEDRLWGRHLDTTGRYMAVECNKCKETSYRCKCARKSYLKNVPFRDLEWLREQKEIDSFRDKLTKDDLDYLWKLKSNGKDWFSCKVCSSCDNNKVLSCDHPREWYEKNVPREDLEFLYRMKKGLKIESKSDNKSFPLPDTKFVLQNEIIDPSYMSDSEINLQLEYLKKLQFEKEIRDLISKFKKDYFSVLTKEQFTRLKTEINKL